MLNKFRQKICCSLAGLIIVNAALFQVSCLAQTTQSVKVSNCTLVQAGENDNSSESAMGFSQRLKRNIDEWKKSYNAAHPGTYPDAVAPNNDNKDVNTEPVNKDDNKNSSKNIDKPALQIQSPDNIQIAPHSQYEQTYNFDWQGTPLNETLYAIGKIAGKRVVINGQISGTVYTSLQDVTYNQALDYLAKTFNFNWMLDEDGNAILISTSNLMLQTSRFDVYHADKSKIKDELKSFGIDEKSIYVNDEYGYISVTGTPYQLSMAAKRINEMDQPVSQVLIVTQLVEVSHGKDLNLGLQYSLPTYSHTGGSTTGTDTLHGNWLEKLTFSASSEASQALSKGKVIARPMIMAKNGQEATIYMGDRVPVLTTTSTSSSTEVTVDYKDIGTSLKVKPFIDEKSGEISMNIDTEISNIAKWIKQGDVSAPQISSRKASTSAHLKSGQSFVIGGLMSTNELDNLSGIPGLMDLPILGNLFKYHSYSKDYTEVFIMVTPYIVTDDIDPKVILKRSAT